MQYTTSLFLNAVYYCPTDFKESYIKGQEFLLRMMQTADSNTKNTNLLNGKLA